MKTVDLSVGDRAPSNWQCPNDFILVMLLAASDRLDWYELLRSADNTDYMDPWGTMLKRGVGDSCEAPSRRRSRSLNVAVPCGSSGSSMGGDDTRRFWHNVLELGGPREGCVDMEVA